MKLNEYDIDIVHRAGAKLVNADCLSRAPIDAVLTISDLPLMNTLPKEQQEDAHWGPFYKRVQEKQIFAEVTFTGQRWKLEEGSPFLWVNRDTPGWQGWSAETEDDD